MFHNDASGIYGSGHVVQNVDIKKVAHGIGRLVILNRVMINELLAVQIGKPVKSCVGARST